MLQSRKIEAKTDVGMNSTRPFCVFCPWGEKEQGVMEMSLVQARVLPLLFKATASALWSYRELLVQETIWRQK